MCIFLLLFVLSLSLFFVLGVMVFFEFGIEGMGVVLIKINEV